MLGFLLVDKPAGCTSHDVVARIRRTLGGTRVGHAGTLDPMATGLLVCGIGQATRVLQYVQDHRKTYEGTLRLGTVTDTQDSTGAVVDKIDGVDVGRRVVELAAKGFVGEIDQVPPAYSAVKVGGVPLHRRMRRGMEYTPPPPRQVTIYSLAVLDVAGTEVPFRVECSSGTYVRTLCHDWGARLDVGGCMSALRRTRIGPFDVTDAAALDTLTSADVIAEHVLPVDTTFGEWAHRSCTLEEAEAVRDGKLLADPAWPLGARVCLTLPTGQVFALARATEQEDGTALKASPVLTDVLQDTCRNAP